MMKLDAWGIAIDKLTPAQENIYQVGMHEKVF